MLRAVISPDDVDDAGLPTWVRVLLRLGVTASIAVFLVYFVTQTVAIDVRATREDVKVTRELLLEHMTEQRFLLRAICINVAQNDAQRANCIPQQR